MITYYGKRTDFDLFSWVYAGPLKEHRTWYLRPLYSFDTLPNLLERCEGFVVLRYPKGAVMTIKGPRLDEKELLALILGQPKPKLKATPGEVIRTILLYAFIVTVLFLPWLIKERWGAK